ncbi:MAG: UDP-N-acetylmuramate--L-alanine ligase [Patescibacteria group bacterium]|jgi:UDP-N-acetylmuramate--alanine ligase
MKYHFIGDRGVSMRGLKEYMELMGHNVSGSDLKSGGHQAKNVLEGTDIVVRTSAVSPGSPGWVEVEESNRRGIKVIKRSELLGEITQDKHLVAVSGMHGKTTITAMAGLLLDKAGYDPTVLVGEEIKEFGGVLRFGRSDWFVAEVCEYDRSFLDVYPEILILTNIEEEHLDTYPGGLPEITEAFADYLKHVSSNGAIIYCHDDTNVRELVEGSDSKAKKIPYGFSSEKYNSFIYDLSIPGNHNIQNALAIVALADQLGIGDDALKSVFATFTGAHRRFELVGKYNGADLIDDYGHHPSEIKATIDALSERYPDKRKYVVFWPHQYKRIRSLLSKFTRSFDGASEVIVKPIYFVPGRDEKVDIDSQDLVDGINNGKQLAKLMDDDNAIVSYLSEHLDADSVLLTIGIPPVYLIAQELASR